MKLNLFSFCTFVNIICFLPLEGYTEDFADFYDSYTNTNLISLSKKEEPAFKAAGSTFIISSDDIRRSGLSDIAEILRLAPGIEVSRTGSSKWGISSRGFGQLYDNKMLVMLDGREMYSSIFSGANWDLMDVVLEDIDKIEIIRGNSGNLWGANSLNGVINIITKDSKYTQGNHLSLTYGTKGNSSTYRYGRRLNKNITYRIHAKQLNRDSLQSIDYLRGNRYHETGDSWQISKAGFRLDWNKDLYNNISLQSDTHLGKENQKLFIPTMEDNPFHDTEKTKGFNFDIKWDHFIDSKNTLNTHVYFDKNIRNAQILKVNRDVFNINRECK